MFNRVWDTPDNGYAEKFKHSIEPYLNVRAHVVDRRIRRIVKLEGTDQIVGGATRYTYGVSEPLLREAAVGGRRARPARRARSSRSSCSRATTRTSGRRRSTRSTRPATAARSQAISRRFALTVRAQPTDGVQRDARRAEFDSQYRELRHDLRDRLVLVEHAAADHRQLEQDGRSSRSSTDSTIRTPRSLPQRLVDGAHAGTTSTAAIYSFNYDVLRATMIQQRISGFYNAQCCGLAFEFQNYQLRQRACRSRPTAVSSCRSRSPGSATSRRSTARSAAFRADDGRRDRRIRIAVMRSDAASISSPAPPGSPAATCSTC